MDHNANKKRKLSQSKEYEGDFKRKRSLNGQSTSCFGRCCTRKKHDRIISIKKEKIPKTSVEKNPNLSMRQLTQSPLYNESTFCQKALESYYDPCIQCNVQYGPDVWENIPKSIQNSHKQLYDQNQPKSTERLDTFLDKKTSADNVSSSTGKFKLTNETINPLKNNVNSFVNNIIGDGVDRVSEMISTTATDRNRQKEFKIDNKLSTNSQQNEFNRKPFDLEQIKQHQYSGLVFEKQSISSQIIADDYNWNLASNHTNFDQQQAPNKKNSSQNQEPYNWDYSEYQSPSPLDQSHKQYLVDKSMNDPSKQITINDKNTFLSDDDSTDFSYSVASVLPTVNSIHSSKLNQDKRQAKNSSDIDVNNDKSPTENILNSNKRQLPFTDGKLPESSAILHQQDTQEQNDRFSATSVSDLFKQLIHAKTQKSLDLDSISTAYSIPISEHKAVVDQHDKYHAKSSRTSSTDKRSSLSSNTEAKELTHVNGIDKRNQTIRPTNINPPTKRTYSHSSNQQEKQPFSTEINNTVHQTRFTYDDIMNPWRHLFERLLSFMFPSTSSTDNNINLSSSTITPNTHSWSTLIPIETLNMTQSDNIGPWWGRRDAYDYTPATFIFANEPLSTSYSMETITDNHQMCISIENRPHCCKYYSCPNTCHCCCNSSSF